MDKILSKRNRLLGLWAAEKLGKTGAAAEAYAQSLEQRDDEDVLHKIRNDVTAARVKLSGAEICDAAERCMREAQGDQR